MVYKPAVFFKSEYGVSPSALRNWASSGKLEHIRTPGGKRLYFVDGVENLLGINRTTTGKRGYIYARVSSTKQQPDLERQIQELQEAYKGYILIQDIGSGINFKRKGLNTLLDRAINGMVSEVVVMHRDRLARFGFDLLELVFTKIGVGLVVHGQNGSGKEEERDLADDLFAVTTLFVASHNGRRAASNRKRRREKEKKGRSGKVRQTTTKTNEDDSN